MFWPFRRQTENALNQTIVRNQSETRHAKALGPVGSDRIACVIAVLLDQPYWDYAIDQQSALENAVFTASFAGFMQPFDHEEEELIKFLSTRFAGRKISTFAWGLYTDLLREQERESA